MSVHLPVLPSLHRSKGRVALHPPHEAHRGGWSSDVESVVFHFSPDVLQDFSETMSRSKAELIPRHSFRDPVVEGLAAMCRNEHRSPHALSSFYIESAAYLLLRHILQRYSSASSQCLSSEGLSAHELSRLTTFIDEKMHSGFNVADLSAWMRIPPSQFAQRLRFSTGLSTILADDQRRALMLVGAYIGAYLAAMISRLDAGEAVDLRSIADEGAVMMKCGFSQPSEPSILRTTNAGKRVSRVRPASK